jgi:protein SCO1/2
VIRLRYPIALLVLAGALCVPLVYLLVRGDRASGGGFRGTTPPAGIRLAQFSLRDESGRVVTTRSLQGKATLVTFLDTACRQACPIIASEVGAGFSLLRADERSRAAALAITVDPERDTPAAVRRFLRRRGLSGSLRYLVASRARLRPVWHRFYVQPVVPGASADIHSDPVRIYNRDGVWVSTLTAGVDLTAANVAHDVRRALG